MAALAGKINASFRKLFGFVIAPIVRLLKPHREHPLVGNLANIISVSRLVLTLVIGYGLITAGSYGLRLFFIVLTALLVISDGIDGELARGLGTITRFGAALDPIADKVFFAVMAIGLALHFGQLAFGIVVGLLLIIELLNMTSGLYAGFLAKRLDQKAGAGDWGKLKFGVECAFLLLGWINPVVEIALLTSWALLIVILPLALMSLSGYLKLIKEYHPCASA